MSIAIPRSAKRMNNIPINYQYINILLIFRKGVRSINDNNVNYVNNKNNVK